MSTIHETYTRRQGLKKTYMIEYTALRYQISLNGKVLKAAKLPLRFDAAKEGEAAWSSAVSDIEYLRGMPEM